MNENEETKAGAERFRHENSASELASGLADLADAKAVCREILAAIQKVEGHLNRLIDEGKTGDSEDLEFGFLRVITYLRRAGEVEKLHQVLNQCGFRVQQVATAEQRLRALAKACKSELPFLGAGPSRKD